MRVYVALCMVALMVGVLAQDEFTFDYACKSNSACVEPGEEYCGQGEVKSVLCIDKAKCQVVCKPLEVQPAEDVSAYINIQIPPKDKRVGQPFTVYLKDNRDNTPLVWGVKIYQGGYFKEEMFTGHDYATAGPGSITVVNNFVDVEYVDGTLVLDSHTNRAGELPYSPSVPGFYVVLTGGKYLSFFVADADGNVMVCGNGECETDLGETSELCSEDCGGETGPRVIEGGPYGIKLICGDGKCDYGETIFNCPEDCEDYTQPGQGEDCIPEGSTTGGYDGAPPCCTGLTPLSLMSLDPATRECKAAETTAKVCTYCGNGECGTGENRCNCPLDCADETTAVVQEAGGGGDSSGVMIIVILVLGVVIVLFLMKSGKIKLGGASTGATGPKPVPPPAFTPPSKPAIEPVPAAAKPPAPEPAATAGAAAGPSTMASIFGPKPADSPKPEPEKPTGPKKCAKCGKVATPGNAFCMGCGAKL